MLLAVPSVAYTIWRTVVFAILLNNCRAAVVKNDNNSTFINMNNSMIWENSIWNNSKIDNIFSNKNDSGFGGLFSSFTLPELLSFSSTTIKTTTARANTTIPPTKSSANGVSVAKTWPNAHIYETAIGRDMTSNAPKARAATTIFVERFDEKSALLPAANIRMRLNEPFFQETAKFFRNVFSNEVKRVRIKPQRQCFQEGCFESHTFHITGFQRPSGITLKPVSPNLLILNIISFDVDILGLISGNVQLLLTSVPVTGQLIVSARQLVLSAVFDLQKSQSHVPFLRMQICQLQAGFVDTRVSDVGLLTDSINLKYKNEMIAKSKEMITSTICKQIDQIIKVQVNARLRQIPRLLAVSQILKTLAYNPAVSIGHNNNKNKSKGSRNFKGVPTAALDQNSLYDTAPEIQNRRRHLFDYVHPLGRLYVNYWSHRRRRDIATDILKTTIKVAKQQPKLGVTEQAKQKQKHGVTRSNNTRETSANVKKSLWNTVVICDEGIASIQELIPEQEEEEQQQTLQQQQDETYGHISTNETTENQGLITLVESTRTAGQLGQSKPANRENILAGNRFHASNHTNSTITVVNGGSKRVDVNDSFKNSANSIKTGKPDVNKVSDRDTDYIEIKAADTSLKSEVWETNDRKRLGNLSTLLDFLDMNALGRIFVDLDFLDSSANADSFTIGVNGDVFAKIPQTLTFAESIQEFPTVVRKADGARSIVPGLLPASVATDIEFKSEHDRRLLADFDEERAQFRPLYLKFPSVTTRRKTLEIAISEMTPNLLLFKAHQARFLKVRVRPSTPIFGHLLRTSCGVDEVCLSDSVPEVGEKYPNQQLELVVETIRAPKLHISKDSVTLHFAGTANFFLINSRKAVGRIPFVGTAYIRARMSSTNDNWLDLNMKLTRLEILEQLDFFNLTAHTLSGLRDAVKGALEHAALQLLASGVDTRALAVQLKRYGLGDFALHLISDGVILLQAELDVYRFAFEGEQN